MSIGSISAAPMNFDSSVSQLMPATAPSTAQPLQSSPDLYVGTKSEVPKAPTVSDQELAKAKKDLDSRKGNPFSLVTKINSDTKGTCNKALSNPEYLGKLDDKQIAALEQQITDKDLKAKFVVAKNNGDLGKPIDTTTVNDMQKIFADKSAKYGSLQDYDLAMVRVGFKITETNKQSTGMVGQVASANGARVDIKG
jgi:hypothetical protein